MIVRFVKQSPTLYTAQWNGRTITVEAPSPDGPWTTRVNGSALKVNGRDTVAKPIEAFRAIESAAQKVLSEVSGMAVAHQRRA